MSRRRGSCSEAMPPLVWVTVGKTQHPAWLLETEDDTRRCWVQWTSTSKKEWVDKRQVVEELSPRSRRHSSPFTPNTSIPQKYGGKETCDHHTGSNKRPRRESRAADGKRSPTANAAGQEKFNTDGRNPRKESGSLTDGKRSNACLSMLSRKYIDDSDSSETDSDNMPLVDLMMGQSDAFDDVDSDDSDHRLLISLVESSPKPVPGRTNHDRTTERPRAVSRSPPNIENAASVKSLNNATYAKPPYPVDDVAIVGQTPAPTGSVESPQSEAMAPVFSSEHAAAPQVPFASIHPLMKRTHLRSTSSLSTTKEVGFSDTDVSASLSLCASNKTAEEEEQRQPRYSLRTSAYLQNLAEISFTILNDRRWRVGTNASLLFQWEAGEDLSVVCALSRQFVPRPPPVRLPCSCLLCRDTKKKEPPSSSKDDATIGTVESVGNEVQTDNALEQNSDGDDDDDEVRALHLYCRLFYRKGPWFRIDDVYNRYYVPKEAKRENDKTYSQPATTAVSSTSQTGKSSSIVDKVLLHKHIEEYLPRLLADLGVLRRMGAVRFFNDEEECGKTVGESLLTSDERLLILSKLGVGKKKRTQSSSSSDNKENFIWKQMCKQKSILSMSGTNGTKVYLPVQRHVDDLLVEKLAKTIVQCCSEVEYIPMQTMRSRVHEIVNSVRKMITSDTFGDGALRFCFRLREGPTLILQRCARLYLCATSGPGEMRSSTTNGWKSLMGSSIAAEAAPPLARAIPPPGQRTWNQVQYPRLEMSFALSSFSFVNAFWHLSHDEAVVSPVASRVFEQVFFSRDFFHCWELCVELRSNVDYLIELNEMLRYNQRREAKGKEALHTNSKNPGIGSIDFLNLRSEEGRKILLNKFLFRDQRSCTIQADVHLDTQEWLTNVEAECEQVLCIIGMIAFRVLLLENENITADELHILVNRPWLRHMSWQCCLAYILWDIIPIFERRDLYRQAVQCLELLVFGSPCTDFVLTDAVKLENTDTLTLPSIWLSRRARGKAIDRLVIDYTHVQRQLVAGADKGSRRTASEVFQRKVTNYCQQVIANTARLGSIGFSSIRTVARRLKQPLAVSLLGVECPESELLGLRFSNDYRHPGLAESRRGGYSDWIPITDRFVANALRNEENGPGARCAFVGFEDDDEKPGLSSLNVEELAMELYRSGRLPDRQSSSPSQGGWMGWHDEGGHVRALFRIVCSAPILGMDFGCAYAQMSNQESLEHVTVHLSPYQGAPFDLHVGFEVRNTAGGFYARRQNSILLFLDKLGSLSDQELSDLIYDSIASRVQYMNDNKQKDPFLDRDLLQIRTLSAVAAGFGGKQLASIFRCFFFDYRHYSGGLPDLHLFRAVIVDPCQTTDDKFTLVDLGEWVGESFSAENQHALAAQQAAAILCDRDDEFLGCSKVGDSGGQASRFSRNGKQLSNTANKTADHSKIPSLDSLPERLQLKHKGHPVRVECMMVEVKSSNDRLDPRQEDWLNILDRYGNARVCKFESKNKT